MAIWTWKLPLEFRPVYIEIDASDQFLLSESVCRQLVYRQLDIVTYHKDVSTHKGKPSTEQMHDKKDQAKVYINCGN